MFDFGSKRAIHWTAVRWALIAAVLAAVCGEASASITVGPKVVGTRDFITIHLRLFRAGIFSSSGGADRGRIRIILRR